MWERFREISYGWADGIFVSEAAGIPKIVYHYTDAAGLVGMLRTGKIWATDFRFLNDRSELQYTRQAAKELISEKLQKATDPLITRLYGNILSRDFDKADDAFIFSMSADPDDLSQWRGYACDGQGFTVGFCGQSIFEISKPDDADFGFLKVEYDRERQLEPLQGALVDLESALREGARAAGANVEDLTAQAASWFVWVVASISSKNKHKSFHVENEWRIVAKVPSGTPDPDIRVRASGVRLVRYLEVPLDVDQQGRLPIKEIGIGPGFVSSEEWHAVDALCRETNYEVKIYSAESPYRRV